MNLDLLPIGWVHFIASVIALILAPIILISAKGTPTHKRRGRIYVAAMLIASGTALAIYRLGIFFFPHWFAIASLATTVIAFVAVRFKTPAKGWVHIHLTFMLASVAILIGGLINELFLRVGFLRQMTHGLNSPLVGGLQAANEVFFVVLIVYFNIREGRRRRTASSGDANALGLDEPRPAAGR
jgi:uncharacterized membrane protein